MICWRPARAACGTPLGMLALGLALGCAPAHRVDTARGGNTAPTTAPTATAAVAGPYLDPYAGPTTAPYASAYLKAGAAATFAWAALSPDSAWRRYDATFLRLGFNPTDGQHTSTSTRPAGSLPPSSVLLCQVWC